MQPDASPGLAWHAHAILREGVAAVQAPRLLNASALASFASGDAPCYLLAVGKAARAMAGCAQALLAEAGVSLARGLVVVPHGVGAAPLPADNPAPHSPVEILEAGHPIPDAAGLAAAERILALAQRAGAEHARLLVLISGGASSLLPAPPPGIALAEIQQVGRLLLHCGAPIDAINTVRRHLTRIGGGRLALAAQGAQLLALVLSDVAGDPLTAIASGPTVADPTSFADAIAVLRTWQLWDAVAPSIREHLQCGAADPSLENPLPGDPRLAHTQTRLVGGLNHALAAAEEAAQRTGYRVQRGPLLTGEARQLPSSLLALVNPLWAGSPSGCPLAILWGGEPTVTIRGPGHGGRCQELALAFALEISALPGPLPFGRWCFAALASDGADGVAPPGQPLAAGAWVDDTTLARAQADGLDPRAALDRNDSAPFHAALGQQFLTGPTHTNVTDLFLLLAEPLPLSNLTIDKS